METHENTATSEKLTRELFGEHLYETLVTIGGIIQLRAFREYSDPIYVKPGALKDWQVREAALVKQLPKLMQQLPDEDVIEITQRYPWVAQC
jgi:hypothetical protein